MSEDYIQLPPDGTGKKVRAIRRPDNRYEEVMVPYSKDGTVDLKDVYSLLEKLTKALATIATDTLRVGGNKNQPFTQREATYELVVQLAHEGTEINPKEITNLPKKGVPQRYYSTASGTVQTAPASGYRLRVFGYKLVAEEDEILRLRYGGATGTIFAICPTKGVVAMNLVNLNEAGGEAQEIYLEKTGTGNALAVVYTETEPV